jgi:hypothetical protein
VNLALGSSIVWSIEGEISFGLWALLFLVKLFALCDAVFRPNRFYVAAYKQTKVVWVAMLGVSMVMHIFAPGSLLGLLSLIGDVVALVYLADVRPALIQSR